MTRTCPPAAIATESSGRFRNRFLARVPVSHTPEDVLSPQYFGLLIQSERFQEGDLIEVEWEDLSRFGVLQIRAVEKQLQLILTIEREPIHDVGGAEVLPDGWTIEFMSQRDGHAIFCNGVVQEGGFPTRERAETRIAALAGIVSQRANVTTRMTRKARAA